MTVSAQPPINRSTGNGVTTVFPYTFKIISSADMEVSVDGVVKTLTVDYTLSGVGDDAGGNVTMLAAPATSTSVVRRRNMALTRNTDYQDQGELPASTLDSDLDSAVLMIQQVDEKTDRAMVLPTYVSGFSTELPTPIANYFLRVNSAGTALELASEITPGALTVTPFIETLLNDSTKADARTTLGAAASGANTDITSLGAVASINGGALAGFRNRIINGDMRVDQRNAGVVTVNLNASFFSADRWLGYGQAADGVFTLQVASDAPAGFSNSLKATVTTTDASIGASQVYKVETRIEGYNVIDLGMGTASPKTITVSFWVKSSVTGTFSCAIGNNADLSYPATYTVISANTWEYKSVVINLPPTGTWNKTNSAGLLVTFPMGVGSTYVGTANTWGNYIISATGSVNLISTLNATFQVTGVQLEVGSVATTFEQRPYGLELALCQRYYYKSYNMSAAPGSASNSGALYTVSGSGSGFYCYTSFPVSMRTTPTITTYNSSTGTSGQWNSSGGSIAALAYPGETGAAINGITALAGHFAWGHIVASAEL